MRRFLKNLANENDGQSFTGTAGCETVSHGFVTVYSLRMALSDMFHDNIYVISQPRGSGRSHPAHIAPSTCPKFPKVARTRRKQCRMS